MAEPARRDPCLGSRPDASPLPPTSETRRSEVRHRNKGQPRRALRSLLISPGCTPHEASQNFNSKRSRGPRPFPVMLCGRACATQPAWRGTFLRREGGRLELREPPGVLCLKVYPEGSKFWALESWDCVGIDSELRRGRESSWI